MGSCSPLGVPGFPLSKGHLLLPSPPHPKCSQLKQKLKISRTTKSECIKQAPPHHFRQQAGMTLVTLRGPDSRLSRLSRLLPRAGRGLWACFAKVLIRLYQSSVALLGAASSPSSLFLVCHLPGHFAVAVVRLPASLFCFRLWRRLWLCDEVTLSLRLFP